MYLITDFKLNIRLYLFRLISDAFGPVLYGNLLTHHTLHTEKDNKTAVGIYGRI